MKRKNMVVIGIVVGCLMMVVGAAWAGGPTIVIPTTPNANGTVSKGSLVWLKNANCFGKQNWDQAVSSAKSLKSGACGLTDGSTTGQWRLPTREELKDIQKSKQYFISIQSNIYWTSVSSPGIVATTVNMTDGQVDYNDRKNTYYILPVRTGP